MTNRLAVALLMVAGLAHAQIVINNHGTGTALPNPFILPDAPVNDSEQFQIDVVNTGTTVVTIDGAVVFGEYYTLCCETGFTLAPAGVQTLTLSFSPHTTGYQSGSLQLGGQVILLFAQGVPAASLFLQTATGNVQAHINSELTFTPASTTVTFVLDDNSSGPVTVNSIYVKGDWVIASKPPTPFTLQAGQQIVFTLVPSTSSISTSGTLTIDQWSYLIQAQPSQPTMQLQVSSPLKSGQQSSIGIQFIPAPALAISGSLQLTFDSSTSVALSDPAILFPSSGTTTVAFTSVPGEAAASFGGAASTSFQTGTTVGTIHVTASWANTSATTDVHITPEPVGIDTTTASRESNALDVTVTGFDNTRTAGAMSFSFFDAKGEIIGDPVAADFTDAFYTYFFQAAYNTGGMFKMTAHFPVTGNPKVVSSVQVDLMNASGDAQSSVTAF